MSGNTYTDEQRAQALEFYDQLGPRAASRETGIPLGTISTWAAADGRTYGAERTRQATEVRRARLIEKLHAIAETGVDVTAEMLDTGDATLRDVVGAWTRAIHDLQLLSGEATTRSEVLSTEEARARLAERLDELAARRAEKAAG